MVCPFPADIDIYRFELSTCKKILFNGRPFDFSYPDAISTSGNWAVKSDGNYWYLLDMLTGAVRRFVGTEPYFLPLNSK